MEWIQVFTVFGQYLKDSFRNLVNHHRLPLKASTLKRDLSAFNLIALRKAKIAYNFGLSECNRVKEKNWLLEELILPFRGQPIQKGGKNETGSIVSPEVYSFTKL